MAGKINWGDKMAAWEAICLEALLERLGRAVERRATVVLDPVPMWISAYANRMDPLQAKSTGAMDGKE